MSGRIMSVSRVRQDYFQWLCELVHANGMAKSYLILLKELHHTDFDWTIENDGDRAEDGKKLRDDYIPYGRQSDFRCLDGPCSMLEMLIALARRIDFELNDPDEEDDLSEKYFWEMIENLGLMGYDDNNYVELDGTFCYHAAISAFLNREYSRNGAGGLFPLKHPTSDQRREEIWYQMNAYVEENYGY